MTKRLVGLFASVALLSSGLALANNEDQGKSQTQSGQQMGGDASGGSGVQGQQGSMGSPSGSQMGQMGSTSGAQMGQKEITGTVVKSSKDKLSLKTDNGIIDFKVDKQTKFQDPTLKKAGDLKEGQQVRTSFDIKDNQNVAKSISLDTSMGGSGLDSDTGINQDMGGSGLDQDINKGKDVGGDVGGSGQMGGDVGGSGDVGGAGDQGGDKH
ncbi:RNA-binding protein [Archangium sp.]|uniref:RNA-binding protein n=1 Tax=Archangium sp. TaxID=1872627 RepID=UPI00389B1A48